MTALFEPYLNGDEPGVTLGLAQMAASALSR